MISSQHEEQAPPAYRPRILVSAYACEPGLGSEEGIGWNLIRHISLHADVWAITQASNREKIENGGASAALPGVRWVYYDLPFWLRFWHKGRRLHRLHYNLWQIGAYFRGKHLSRSISFDMTHHLTFGQYWTATYLSLLPVPFLWGPVGGGESAPGAFYRTFGLRGWLFEVARDLSRSVGELHPMVRRSARATRVALATSPETAARLRRLGRREVEIVPNVALAQDEYDLLSSVPIRDREPLRFVSIGRMLSWKGFHLGLQAFARFVQDYPESEYWFIGSGPERNRLERMAAELGAGDRVKFWGVVARPEVLNLIAECDALLHPSLHDSGGWVCLEAMAAGRPVLCLDLGGPAILVTEESGFKVAAETPEQAIEGLHRAMAALASEPGLKVRKAQAARAHVAAHHRWEQKAAFLLDVYRREGRHVGAR